jgi:hypothetical protein
MDPLLTFPTEINNEVYGTKLQPGKRVSKGSKLSSLVVSKRQTGSIIAPNAYQ